MGKYGKMHIICIDVINMLLIMILKIKLYITIGIPIDISIYDRTHFINMILYIIK